MESNITINSKEQIDKLIENLKASHSMTPKACQDIFQKIQKTKLQIYFKENYPESMFKDDNYKKVDILALLGVKNENSKPEITTIKRPTISLPSETKGAKKYIYGTYIEMAFHNFFLNMRYIYKVVFGIDIMEEAKKKYELQNPDKHWDEDFASEEYVWEPIFDKCQNSRPEEQLKIVEMILGLFPVMAAIKKPDEINIKKSIGILKRLSQTIRILRNFYSHYIIYLHDNQVVDYEKNKLFVNEVLRKAYFGSKNTVRTRFSYDDNDMRCAEQFEYINNSKKKIPDFKYKIVDADKHLTAFGLVFLISLFLEKKYSKIFTDKLKCIPKEDQHVMNELIAVYRIRLHSEKLTISKNTNALAFDILTELRKCPKELFEHLSPENQRAFRVKAADEENGIDEVLMVRHSDRFPYMMLKYIDDKHLFGKIRFQVSLGKYFFKFYDKYCIDNSSESRVRALSKNVNGFGRISEMEKLRTKNWESLIRKFDDIHKNTACESPYITDHEANYIITGNRIAMRFCNDYSFPKISQDGVHNPAPTCWMSTYELPAMMFLIHLTNSQQVEDIIQKTVDTYWNFFNDIAEGTLLPVSSRSELEQMLTSNYQGLTIQNVPQDMVRYLSGDYKNCRKNFKECALQRIDDLIEETKYLQEKFNRLQEQVSDSKNNKLGKKSYVSIKPGKLASFLAKDIMLFQPNDADNKNKLTSLNFRILQSALALHDKENNDSLTRMFESAHIINTDDDSLSNPIIRNLWRSKTLPTDTIEFYNCYLDERLKYLQSCKSRNLSSLSFLYANRIRWQEHDADFYRAKAERYLHENYMGTNYDKAMELPRGLFDSYIRNELMKISAMKNMAADKGKNIAYLIYAYVKNVLKDECQPMYGLRRTYPLLKKLDKQEYYTPQELSILLMQKNKDSFVSSIKVYCEKNRDDKKSCTEDSLKAMLAHLKDNETNIKQHKVQDMILFMMAKKMLAPETENEEREKGAFSNMHLRDMQNGNILSQKINFKVTITSKNGYGKTIYQNDLKLKDYATFYRFLLDRRMPTLLDLTSNRIDRKKIDEELNGYDKVHPSILEQVMQFEKENYVQGNDIDFGNILNKVQYLNENDKVSLRKIRNSFAHCIYPHYRYIGEEANKTDLPKKAEKISETFKEKIKKN